MPKRLALLAAMLVLLPVAFTPPVLAQEELEGGSVMVDGHVVIDCAVAFEDLEGFRDNPPSDRISQRDYEEALGYVRLCTERSIVPPFDGPGAGEPQNGSTVSGSSGVRQLPATGGLSLLFALSLGISILAASLVVGGLLAHRTAR